MVGMEDDIRRLCSQRPSFTVSVDFDIVGLLWGRAEEPSIGPKGSSHGSLYPIRLCLGFNSRILGLPEVTFPFETHQSPYLAVIVRGWRGSAGVTPILLFICWADRIQ